MTVNPTAPKPIPPMRLARTAWRRWHERGGRWVWRRIVEEVQVPTTLPGRSANRALRRLMAWRDGLRGGARREGDVRTLHAFYDLRVQPITFDVLWFLVGAELERRRQGLDRVQVVIVPGPHQGVRQEPAEYERVVGVEARRWRIYNLLVPAAACLPTLAGVSVACSRAAAGEIAGSAGGRVYPTAYRVELPVVHLADDILAASGGDPSASCLRAPAEALASVDRWLASHAGGRRVVAITLRDYGFGQKRNSDLDAWTRFARTLDPRVFLPVFVLDTETAFDQPAPSLGGFTIFHEAPWNLHLRAAFYQRAWLNMGVNTGPLGLCCLNAETRYLVFKFVVPDVAQTTEAFMRQHGFEPGRQLSFATPVQKWVWADDSFEVLSAEFALMRARIEALPPPATRESPPR